jgi:hypothetical protein
MIIAVLSVSLTLILGTVCSVFAQSDLDSVLATAKESLNTHKNRESKTETETVSSVSSSNYKNYENSIYGVKLKYPDAWTWTYQDPDFYESYPEIIFNVIFISPTKGDVNFASVTISIENLEPALTTLEQYRDQTVTYLRESFPDIKDIQVSKVTLGGQPAYRIQSMQKFLDYWKQDVSTYTVNDGKLYSISVLAKPEEMKLYSQDINTMIQSTEFGLPAPIKVSSTDVPDKPVVKIKNSPNVVKKPTTQSNCDSSYPDFCIPSPPPNLNCPNIPQKRFTVSGSDPHGFDRDNDAIGCES